MAIECLKTILASPRVIVPAIPVWSEGMMEQAISAAAIADVPLVLEISPGRLDDICEGNLSDFSINVQKKAKLPAVQGIPISVHYEYVIGNRGDIDLGITKVLKAGLRSIEISVKGDKAFSETAELVHQCHSIGPDFMVEGNPEYEPIFLERPGTDYYEELSRFIDKTRIDILSVCLGDKTDHGGEYPIPDGTIAKLHSDYPGLIFSLHKGVGISAERLRYLYTMNIRKSQYGLHTNCLDDIARAIADKVSDKESAADRFKRIYASTEMTASFHASLQRYLIDTMQGYYR